METVVGKDMIRVGSRKYMEENNVSLEESQEVVRGILHRGEIIIYVAKNENLIGVIGVSDPPRENIKKAINRLRNQGIDRSEEHTSELQSRQYLVCRLLLEKKKNSAIMII